ncbi:MAG: DegT/DnrJ/EryC1/StrS aminotransferase family protein [Candidatus Aenigmatarchaeota archaeon]
MLNKQIKIPVTKPYFTEEESKSVLETLQTGWIVQGPKVRRFEEIFKEFVGAKYSIATTSCTTALHLSLIASGIKQGDKIIVPSFTFVATANVVEYVGARPIFCDIDLHTYNISVDEVEKILKRCKKIKAIIPVHLFGLSADIDSIVKLAKEYNLTIIEDAACGLGSYYKGKHVGTFGKCGCFSFHPRKVITTGEGGMIVTNNEKVAKLCYSLRDHGTSRSDYQRHMEKGGSTLPEYNAVGYNYRMTDIQAAIGIAQMYKAKNIIKERINKAKTYNKFLKGIAWLKLPYEPDNCIHSYQSYVCLIDKKEFNNNIKKANIFRNKLMIKLEKKGIATRQGTHAVHTLGYYKKKYNIEETSLPNSFEADRLSITLPLYHQMTEEEQEYVVEQIKKCAE